MRRAILLCKILGSVLSASWLVGLLAIPAAAHASWLHHAKSTVLPVPAELQDKHFQITIDGQPAPVMNAAMNYYVLNFIQRGRTTISITAPTPDYWAHGVEVQPWRENIRPARSGATITFTLNHPAKLTITRPGEPLGTAEMLFLFANAPQPNAPTAQTPGIRYIAPGIHHGGIDAHTGDRIYLAPGAVVLGGLNLWDVHDVKVFGLGTLIYDGQQDPNDDTGWMNKPNWHCIVMHDASHIEINDLTCIVRSRTWMVQMKDSHNLTFDNVKIIGGNNANANNDGMDFVGSGDATVRDVFIRAADDDIALIGNWDGYQPDILRIPGNNVGNITIENSILSTSISNTVRLSWPGKIFNSTSFTMRNVDVEQMGIGSCGIPFALLELWGVPDSHGTHQHYLFDNIRLEHWYTLTQIQQTNPQVRDITFNNIWSPEQPPSLGSSLLGDVSGVQFSRIKTGNQIATTAADLNLSITAGAAAPAIDAGATAPHAAFTYAPGPTGASQSASRVRFDAAASTAPASSHIVSYDWFFGDGDTAHGKHARHIYRDTGGTLLDGSGRFRVMLRVTDNRGNTDWTSQPVVLRPQLPALAPPAFPAQPGLRFFAYTGDFADLAQLSSLQPVTQGATATLTTAIAPQPEHFALAFDGFINVPADGGYTFTALSRDGSRLTIDDNVVLTNPAPWAQVCGGKGNAVQQAQGSIGLRQGLHRIRIEMSSATGDPVFRLLWQAQGIALGDVPSSAFSFAPDAVQAASIGPAGK